MTGQVCNDLAGKGTYLLPSPMTQVLYVYCGMGGHTHSSVIKILKRA